MKNNRIFASSHFSKLNFYTHGPVVKPGRFFVSCVAILKPYTAKRFDRFPSRFWGGFLRPFRIWPFSGDLTAFWRPGGITYHPRRKCVLNRKNAENNFFLHKKRKNYEKTFGI